MSNNYEFVLNIDLLESIRQFSHVNHQFSDTYLKSLLSTLHHLRFNLADETSTFTDITNLKVKLAIHFALSNAINLSQLITLYHKDIIIPELDIEQINNTNIFNHDSLYIALKNAIKDFKPSSSKLEDINLIVSTSKQSTVRGLNLDQITIQITEDEKQDYKSSKDRIIIPIQLVILLILMK